MKRLLSVLLSLCLLICLPFGAALSEETKTGGTASAVLVVYFSATGHTRPLAEYAAKHLDAELLELVAAQPYTTADLNYNASGSRVSLEHGDAAARPEIAALPESLDAYDTVVLGYPIWWGEAPRIISTFLEHFDLSGKTIVPFCTSASSGMGSSARKLQALCGEDVTWLEGKRFPIGTDEETFTAWLDGLGLNTSAQ